jgi:hypothetical protein
MTTSTQSFADVQGLCFERLRPFAGRMVNRKLRHEIRKTMRDLRDSLRKDDSVLWTNYGVEHRETNSSVRWTAFGIKWRHMGSRHREDGPAVYDRDGGEAWYRDGKLHRLDGPAQTGPRGLRWFVRGQEITDEVRVWRRDNGVPFPKAGRSTISFYFGFGSANSRNQ